MGRGAVDAPARISIDARLAAPRIGGGAEGQTLVLPMLTQLSTLQTISQNDRPIDNQERPNHYPPFLFVYKLDHHYFAHIYACHI